MSKVTRSNIVVRLRLQQVLLAYSGRFEKHCCKVVGHHNFITKIYIDRKSQTQRRNY